MKHSTVEQAIKAQKTSVPSDGRRGDPASALSQQSALQAIEALRVRYQAGHPFALLWAIRECANFGLVMPDWVAQAYIARLRLVTHFKLRTLDEAFGHCHPDQES
ncbi:MAG: hypothetical protein JJT93_00630 [Gammaproteobacteria bacterium]|nr:hypothetical protein [Gammaproteobacteria bacterium]